MSNLTKFEFVAVWEIRC